MVHQSSVVAGNVTLDIIVKDDLKNMIEIRNLFLIYTNY